MPNYRGAARSSEGPRPEFRNHVSKRDERKKNQEVYTSWWLKQPKNKQTNIIMYACIRIYIYMNHKVFGSRLGSFPQWSLPCVLTLVGSFCPRVFAALQDPTTLVFTETSFWGSLKTWRFTGYPPIAH